jgi:hypothetical protein
MNVTFASIGGYLGTSLAYVETFMTLDTGAAVMYTPNSIILFSGIMLGVGLGYMLSEGIQQAYYSS